MVARNGVFTKVLWTLRPWVSLQGVGAAPAER